MASTLLQSRAEGALLLDPTTDEAAREEAGLTLALMPACSEVCWLGALGWLVWSASKCSLADSDYLWSSVCPVWCSLGSQPCFVQPESQPQPPLPSSCPQVTQLVSRGPWSSSQLREALELAMGGCAQLDALARQVLKTAAAEAAARRQQEAQQQQAQQA